MQRRIHSHNDYWRDVPVYTALSHGVCSIEADVWLNPKDDKLYVRWRPKVMLPLLLATDVHRPRQVSHNVASLTKARTFKSLYVDQLVLVLEHANVHDAETTFFDETDFYSMDDVREERTPWTRCFGAILLLFATRFATRFASAS